MANSPQSRKRVRQATKRRIHNQSRRAMMRTTLKKVIAAIEAGDAAEARDAYQAAVPIIDISARNGLLHRNKAARHKSRLNARIRAMSAPSAEDKAAPTESDT